VPGDGHVVTERAELKASYLTQGKWQPVETGPVPDPQAIPRLVRQRHLCISPCLATTGRGQGPDRAFSISGRADARAKQRCIAGDVRSQERGGARPGTAGLGRVRRSRFVVAATGHPMAMSGQFLMATDKAAESRKGTSSVLRRSVWRGGTCRWGTNSATAALRRPTDPLTEGHMITFRTSVYRQFLAEPLFLEPRESSVDLVSQERLGRRRCEADPAGARTASLGRPSVLKLLAYRTSLGASGQARGISLMEKVSMTSPGFRSW